MKGVSAEDGLGIETELDFTLEYPPGERNVGGWPK